MAPRRRLRCFSVVALCVCAWAGCKNKTEVTKAPAGATDLYGRCEKLGKACGDTDKHIENLVDACKQASVKQSADGCAAGAVALYDCYEKELCGKGEKIWSLEDLRVLADRHGKCVNEQNADRECAKK